MRDGIVPSRAATLEYLAERARRREADIGDLLNEIRVHVDALEEILAGMARVSARIEPEELDGL